MRTDLHDRMARSCGGISAWERAGRQHGRAPFVATPAELAGGAPDEATGPLALRSWSSELSVRNTSDAPPLWLGDGER